MRRRPLQATVSYGLTVAILLLLVTQSALADPCGMVPPVYIDGPVPIVRIGDQKTYVFFKDGIETFVIRPGFEGKVDEFGMLIPFPSVPALRKVSDSIFPHIAAAIDPPEVVIDLRFRFRALKSALPQASAVEESGLAVRNEVRVLKQEAVGMYEVAVLAAGSSAALKKWMDDHGFKYPAGMDKACDDYIEAGWCFVAVKTKVGQKKGVDPKPGQRRVNPNLPAGSTFDGHVQAMGFRFKVNELVVPMRLSTFNKGKLKNIVYVLTDKPMKIRSVPERYVVRQISGEQLINNVTRPLPLRIIGGTIKNVPEYLRRNLKQRRDPVAHNGAARDLFASDLLTVTENRLSHPHEETEKMYLRIGEKLGLRGPLIDKLNEGALKSKRDETVKRSLATLKGMTLTVIHGDFPREVLANENLTFAPFKMAARRNRPSVYDAKQNGPARKQDGRVYYQKVSTTNPQPANPPHPKARRWQPAGIAAFASLLLLGTVITIGRGKFRKTWLALMMTAGTALLVSTPTARTQGAEEKSNKKETSKPASTLMLIDRLGNPKKAEAASKALIARGKASVPHLIGEAIEGRHLAVRGWAIVCLTEIGGKEIERRFVEIYRDKKQPALVRTWAAAGQVKMADSSDELLRLATLIPQFPALGRPIGMRLVEKLSKPGEKVSAEDLLNATVRVPQLQQALAPAILAQGAGPLVKAMISAKNQNARRMAAAYLGTMAQKGDKAVPTAVVAAYAFNPNAKDVPWTGGPLFVPGLAWSKDDARSLVGNLISWHLWCENNLKINRRVILQRQLHNNLRSLQLAKAAGYQSPGFQEVGSGKWLTVWGQAVGRKKLKALLDQQGLADVPRYKRILGQLN